MIRVGFVDYYLDEWHANNYPRLLHDRSGGQVKVCAAYGRIDSPLGGMTNREWGERNGIPVYESAEEVVAASDVLIVLSPDNPEMHEVLCEVPLSSGKLTYIDKTFAPDKETAERIFAMADRAGAKCYSSSALGFAEELDQIDMSEIEVIYSEGPGKLSDYIIHQIEPVVRLINVPAKRVMYTGNREHPAAIVEFLNGKVCHMVQRNDKTWSHRLLLVNACNGAQEVIISSDYFGRFIDGLIRFFQTGEIQVAHERTVTAIAVREALLKASEQPFCWVSIL